MWALSSTTKIVDDPGSAASAAVAGTDAASRGTASSLRMTCLNSSSFTGLLSCTQFWLAMSCNEPVEMSAVRTMTGTSR